MDLKWETYKLFIFDDPNAEYKYQQYRSDAEEQLATDPQLVSEVDKAAREGKRAAALAATVKQKLRLGDSPDEVRTWIDETCKYEPGRVVKSVNTAFKKAMDWKTGKGVLREKNRNFKISLPYTPIENGLHPQNLRALPSSPRWEIYIDETGKEFSAQAQALNETDSTLGRVIALAMPESCTLPGLGKSTHATELTYTDIEAMLHTLRKSDAGILGATLKSDLHSHSWIAAIVKLARWILLMLPMDGQTMVTFKIENRGEYRDSRSMKALEETLLDELRRLAPERFATLNLSLKLIDKDERYNGYVDVIANCWGSSDKTKKKLLNRTGWPGHCLLQSTDVAEIDRLYREAESDLDPATWFAICTHLTKEPGHSLFHDVLALLGERTRCDAALWRKYLAEVRYRIAHKRFDAGSLGRALTWLDNYHPSSARLPGLLELQMKSAQLAGANHLGQCDVQQVAQVMAAANALKEESAHDACEAALRIAISATNGFDFTSAVPFIEDWLTQPIAVPGRLNHGKLHSTLGQLCAFRGEYPQALAYFEAALEQFSQLSDPDQATSNRRQTEIYKAIALMDLQHPDAPLAIRAITEQATGKSGAPSIRQLARSASPLRFEHYLLLRWLVRGSEETQEQLEYLGCFDDWQNHEGHPWMLINAYRAWMLANSLKSVEAVVYLQKAVDECCDEENSAILHWMAHCLHALGDSLALELEPPRRTCPEAPFPSAHLGELRHATSNQERIHALDTLLPFNFH
ncbi:hypothetical protein E4634_16100 [Mangrovimicrobium sediminis]|uniref:Tetratricopeptide repeat protein n=1 Tax=Mangrovimicrobium sediminis TaxID=2562682 RepID=A0A4Z0LYH8_9GAMM|nr:hypothetical protein [Haliea sp. SAOS-164]TGD72188.1 hypothetical protein E4634_16100 [Haliea sp. SAOS-164]